jgi:hypothetical protein
MRRWLVVGVAAVGAFLIGGVAGSALSRAHAKQLWGLCRGLFEDHHNHAILTMELIASGRTDSVYDLAEDEIVLCALPPIPQERSHDSQRCADTLKAFYSRYPDRKANLERRKPDEARHFGLAAGP